MQSYRGLEEVAKPVGGGYCRLQMPLKLALAVRETVAGRRLRPQEGAGGGLPFPPSNASLPYPVPMPYLHSPSKSGPGRAAWGSGLPLLLHLLHHIYLQYNTFVGSGTVLANMATIETLLLRLRQVPCVWVCAGVVSAGVCMCTCVLGCVCVVVCRSAFVSVCLCVYMCVCGWVCTTERRLAQPDNVDALF